MKNPVPERSPCSSVPRILTTALPAFSKTSLTSRLIELVDASAGCCGGGVPGGSSARANATAPKTVTANARRSVIAENKTGRFGNRGRSGAGPGLEPESRLITHWGTIEHVARRRRDPVSFGAVFDSTNKRWAKVAGRDWSGEAPVRIRQRGCRHDWSTILGRHSFGRGGLVNFERNHRGADDDGR